MPGRKKNDLMITNVCLEKNLVQTFQTEKQSKNNEKTKHGYILKQKKKKYLNFLLKKNSFWYSP